MSARISLADLPAKYQEQATAQLATAKPVGVARAAKAREKVASTLRQKSGPKLNKTEAAFLLFLEHYVKTPYDVDATIHAQNVTLILANGVRYTPDFVTVKSTMRMGDSVAGHAITAWEVKGFMRDDAAVKLKVAATQYPWMSFVLVTRRDGTWRMEEVKP